MAAPGTPVTDYKADQIDILYNLVEASNPGFKALYPKGTIQFGAPSVIAVQPGDPYKNDTSMVISPAPGSSALGKQTVFYRRIDLSTVFRNMKLTLSDYVASGTLPVATWKASFVTKYGIVIPASDISNTAALTSGVATTMSAATTCQCYKGSVSLTWTVGVRPFTNLVTDANRALVGRLYPGGNDFTTPGRKPQGEFLVFCQDASALKTSLEAFTSGGVPLATDPLVVALVNFLLNSTTRTDWNAGSAAAAPGGITGLNWYKYSLPNATIPEANSAKYTRCIVIQSLAGSWFAGKIIIHYNA